MIIITQVIKNFVKSFDYTILNSNLNDKILYKVLENPKFLDFIKTITEIDVYSEIVAKDFEKENAITGLSLSLIHI